MCSKKAGCMLELTLKHRRVCRPYDLCLSSSFLHTEELSWRKSTCMHNTYYHAPGCHDTLVPLVLCSAHKGLVPLFQSTNPTINCYNIRVNSRCNSLGSPFV